MRPVVRAVLNPTRTRILQVLVKNPRTLEEIKFMLGAEHDAQRRIEICDAVTYLSQKKIIRLNREYKFQLIRRIIVPSP
jgi:predicted transcriptional regulator